MPLLYNDVKVGITYLYRECLIANQNAFSGTDTQSNF